MLINLSSILCRPIANRHTDTLVALTTQAKIKIDTLRREKRNGKNSRLQADFLAPSKLSLDLVV